jgi:NAD-dependent dihydropyrimidine dehydrogenase PreA subunit
LPIAESFKKIITQKITVDVKKCLGCGACIGVCPFMVYEIKKDKKGKKIAVPVYQEDCFLCQSCQAQCPVDAITIDW